MATRFIERNASPTAVPGDTAGNVAPIGIDSDSEELKFYDRTASADRTVVTTDQTQTLTGKTVAGPETSEVVTAANILTAAESGKTFYLDALAGFLTTFPAPALGLVYRFVVKTAPTSNGYTFAPNGGTADIIVVHVTSLEINDTVDGIIDDNADLLTLVANSAAKGDYLEARSDGTSWYVTGVISLTASLTAATT
jgi:hypothetical protein